MPMLPPWVCPISRAIERPNPKPFLGMAEDVEEALEELTPVVLRHTVAVPECSEKPEGAAGELGGVSGPIGQGQGASPAWP